MIKTMAPVPQGVVECQQCSGPMRHEKGQPYFCADCGAHLYGARPIPGCHWEIHWGWLVNVETCDRDYEDEVPIGPEWTFLFEIEDHENEWAILSNGPDFETARASAEGYVRVYLRRIFSGPTWDHLFKGIRLSSWEAGEPDDTCLWDYIDGRAFVWNPNMPEAR